ncbi:MAG: ABC transporter substrate-binding protein [Trueperaceae bacterium]
MKFFFILLFALALAGAQPYKVGVILSQTGRASSVGQQQAKALELLKTQLQKTVFGQQLEFLIRDDASLPANAAREAKDLLGSEDIVALVCCSSESSSEAIRDYVGEQSLLTLALSDIPKDTVDSGSSDWLFTVKPDTQRYLQSIILQLSREGQQSIGVMTPDNDTGDTVQGALDMLLTPGGMHLAVLQRYDSNANVLTPEALWVATRQPSSILVWGSPSDSLLAYKALRARGFEENVFLNPDLLDSISVPTLYNDAVFPLAAVRVGEAPDMHPNYLEAFRFGSAIAAKYGPNAVSHQAAYAYDAVLLLQGALEQALTFGIPSEDTTSLRYAMRDALIGMPPHKGAAAVYDYSESDFIGVDPYSLVLAKVVNGEFVSLP